MPGIELDNSKPRKNLQPSELTIMPQRAHTFGRNVNMNKKINYNFRIELYIFLLHKSRAYFLQ